MRINEKYLIVYINAIAFIQCWQQAEEKIMYEFHGWININYDTHDTDLKRQDDCVNKCLDFIKSESGFDEKNYKIVRHNGVDSFLVSGQHNHHQDYIINTFKWIAENAKGSYGILTVFDDEDEFDNHNFKNYIIKRGAISESKDNFFSPRQPVIEDFNDSNRD